MDIKKVFLTISSILLGVGSVITFVRMLSKKIDIIEIIDRTGSFEGELSVILFSCILWYVVGQMFGLFQEQYLRFYTVVGVIGMACLWLNVFVGDLAAIVEPAGEILNTALRKANEFEDTTNQVLRDSRLPWGEAMQGIVLLNLIISSLGGIAFIIIFFAIGYNSPIYGGAIVAVILLLSYKNSPHFGSGFVFLIEYSVITFILLYIWGYFGKIIWEKKNQKSFTEKIKELFEIKKEEVIAFIVCLLVFFIGSFLGFFQSWNNVLDFWVPSEYSDMSNQELYQSGSSGVAFIISTLVSSSLALIVNKILGNKSIIMFLTNAMVVLLVQLTMSEFLVKWISEFINTPSQLTFVMGVVAVVLVVLFFVFQFQCYYAIFAANIIFMTLSYCSIDMSTWPPMVTSFVFAMLLQFLNEHVMLTVLPD